MATDDGGDAGTDARRQAGYAETFASEIAGVSLSVPRVLRGEDARPSWNAVPQSEEPGFRRGLYPRVHATNMLGRLVVVPPGQRSPKHINSADHLVLQLEGEAEFDFPDTPGQDPIRIRPRDILFFPANIPYLYRNVGDVDVVWFTVLGRKDDWPPTQSFYDDVEN